MTEKKTLNLEDIEAQTALELPDREMMAVAVGGLVALAIDRVNVDIPINVDLDRNTICVNVAVLGKASC